MFCDQKASDMKSEYKHLTKMAKTVVFDLTPVLADEKTRKKIIRLAVKSGALSNGSGLHSYYGVQAHKSVLAWLGLRVPIRKPTTKNFIAAQDWWAAQRK